METATFRANNFGFVYPLKFILGMGIANVFTIHTLALGVVV
jgi:hypothetical protein